MSKKISTIFLSLFLIGILSVSCSNADKTGAGETTKGIEQYNGNTYVSESAIMDSTYLWVSNTVAGDLKFTSNGSSVTVTFTKSNPAPEVVGKPFVCNIKK